MGEPLTKKKIVQSYGADTESWIMVKDVKSAVEWLKERIGKYPNIQLTHMKLNALIDEAFPDLMDGNKK